jgi:hypothetical protein
MSNPDKSWSWRVVIGTATGNAIGGGVVAAVGGALLGPPGALAGGLIGAAGGFAGGLLGSAMGHVLDDPFDEEFGSAALFGAAVGGLLVAILFFLALNTLVARPRDVEQHFAAITGLSGFIAALVHALRDDVQAKAAGRDRDRLYK